MAWRPANWSSPACWSSSRSFTVAWHTEPLALKRAELGDHHEDLLGEIADLEKLIAKTPARSLADAAVKLRRLFAGLDGEMHTQMLVSALTVIEAQSAASPA